MSRNIRIEYPGAFYHVMNHGDGRQVIFENDEDRLGFLETLAEVCQKTRWQIHAYCLMDKYFHLVIETPKANLVMGMKSLLGIHTNRHNRRHKTFGHLFSGRYQAQVVEGSGGGYLKTVCDYVHLNPARAGLLAPRKPLSDFCWSSYPRYLAAPGKRPDWLRTDRLLGECSISKDSVAGRRAFGERMEQRRRENLAKEFKAVEQGWYLGSEPFRQKLLAKVSTAAGPSHSGEAVREAAEAQAERLVVAGLKRLGWDEAGLKKRRKGDRGKVALAKELRASTKMTLDWIAKRLRMGSPGYLAWLLKKRKPSPRTKAK
jgi:REP element-mobilizing transposase RayT